MLGVPPLNVTAVTLEEKSRFLRAIPHEVLRYMPENLGRYLNEVLLAGLGLYLIYKAYWVAASPYPEAS